ncbi:MAG: FIST C-terminal domain-containing protein [Candidatus Omnitrophica bacterium]|nr:FIST C-terminal domain-containing protein [Candidatus Omnitrophota bacterium]
MEEKFAIAHSEKKGEEAAKEVSLKIKSVFPKAVKDVFLFFTPQYNPQEALKTINFTLKPRRVIGLQSPFLNFEDKILEEGMVAFVINKEQVELKEVFVKEDTAQKIESALRMSLKDYSYEKEFIFSFLSHNFNYRNYLRGLELAAGKSFNVFGAGYIRKYAARNYQIVNNTVTEGLVNIIGGGIKETSLSIAGFIPLGKPFTITKIMAQRSIIMEINGKPAINIYKDYLEDKSDTFIKNYLFSLYPLGVYYNGDMHLINVIECLKDGSLACIGNLKENVEGHIMFFHSQALFDELKKKLEIIKSHGEGLVFMVNSMLRKKILRDYAHEESYAIKQLLGDKFKVIGIYADYSFFSEPERREINLEAGNILMTLWK